MIEIKDTPAITQLGYCNDSKGRELEIEIMLYNNPVQIHGNLYYSIIRTTYVNTKVMHSIELYQILLNEAQCTEAIKNISANPDNFKLHASK